MSDLLRCPRCGCPDVQVNPGRTSACAPMPTPDLLRCPRCENTGVRLRLSGRAQVRWDHDSEPPAS